MLLTPEPNVPDTLTAEVAGADGGKAVAAMCSDGEAANLCVQDRTRSSMACVALNQAGWSALRDLADEMVRQLAPKEAHGHDH